MKYDLSQVFKYLPNANHASVTPFDVKKGGTRSAIRGGFVPLNQLGEIVIKTKLKMKLPDSEQRAA